MKNCGNCLYWDSYDSRRGKTFIADGYLLPMYTVSSDEKNKEWGVCMVCEVKDDIWGDVVDENKPPMPKNPLMRLTTTNWCSLETHRNHYCGQFRRVQLKVMI